MDKQQELQDCVDEELDDFTDTADDGKYKMQGAAVCIDNSTGQVVAMVGGRSQEIDAGLTLNRAFQSHRQPGSSIKPLVVYAPAFEKGYYPGTLVEDQEIEDGPKNFDGGYMGELELSEAVQRSLNTIAWQVYEDITPKYGLSKLKAMHFSMIVDSDNVPATSLGGFTYGVEPVEMAAGYSTLQNDGKYRIPSCISRIEDYKGETIYTYEGTSSKIYDKNAAREMVSVLQGVMEEGWGTGRGLRLRGGMPCAGKTGTTDDAKDGWFCGFTHYYTTAVWVGCDTPESVRGLQGAAWPGRIWNSFMNLIHEELEPVEFKDYDREKEKRALKDQEWSDDDDDDYDYHEEPTVAATKEVKEKDKDKYKEPDIVVKDPEKEEYHEPEKQDYQEPEKQEESHDQGGSSGGSGGQSSGGGGGQSSGGGGDQNSGGGGGQSTGGGGGESTGGGGENTGGGGENTGGGGENTGGGGENTGGGEETGGGGENTGGGDETGGGAENTGGGEETGGGGENTGGGEETGSGEGGTNG